MKKIGIIIRNIIIFIIVVFFPLIFTPNIKDHIVSLLPQIFITYIEDHYDKTFPIYSSAASILSYVFLLPILIWQSFSDKTMLDNIDKNVKNHLQELRRVDNPNKGLTKLLEWIQDEEENSTKGLLYVSKLSIIPGFWIRGPCWMLTNLNKDSYADKHLVFAGPSADSETFTNLIKQSLNISAQLEKTAITMSVIERIRERIKRSPNIAKQLEKTEFKELDNATRTYLLSIKNQDNNFFKTEYGRCIATLRQKGIEVVELDDDSKQAKLNFVLRKIPPERSPVNSPWEMMFFDDADILNGKKTKSDLNRVFFDPEIYSAQNPTLGNMFQFIAAETNDQIKF